MMQNTEMTEYVSKIIERYELGNIEDCKKINTGFNRVVYSINDKYILKICVNIAKEPGVKNEIAFYNSNDSLYCPKLIFSDETKSIIPYVYTIEKKIIGKNLFEIWTDLNATERERILFELIKVLKKIHKPVDDEKYNIGSLIDEFDRNLERCIVNNIFSRDEIEYLKTLEGAMPQYLNDVKIGYIHGDVHFDNIIISHDGLKLIDFECYSPAPLDKEFDSINRMIRNPSSFIVDDSLNLHYNKRDFKTIMNIFKELYPEVCKNKNFDNRLIIYDCLNSIKWIYHFPEHKLYHEVLFKNSKRLIKKI